jgi:hypothetical protein
MLEAQKQCSASRIPENGATWVTLMGSRLPKGYWRKDELQTTPRVFWLTGGRGFSSSTGRSVTQVFKGQLPEALARALICW